jgi:drug/metabolite transporter (DMT)-like permease
MLASVKISMRANSKSIPAFEFGLLLMLGALWGLPYALTKIALQTIPPITLTAGRVSLAATALWIIAKLLGRKLPRRWDFTWYLRAGSGNLHRTISGVSA